MNTEVPQHVVLGEPALLFHPDRKGDIDIHPLRGLLRFGPYSTGLLVPDPIRIATIAPKGESGNLYEFMRELSNTYRPRERRDYLPDWPGFRSVFGLRITAASSDCRLELVATLDNDIPSSPTPHVVLADAITRAIQRLIARRSEFDVLFIYLPERWSAGYTTGEGEDFDLHDHIKAFTAVHSIPVQLVRQDSALAYYDRASVMWRVALAIYAKAGGIPWKLAGADPECAYIGVSYSVRPRTSDQPRFVTCCSQVFDAEGSGLEFVAYDTNDFNVERDNPFLSHTEMFRVMSRAMDLYRRRHAGRVPRRLMVHKTTEFKSEEVAGCLEAFHLCEAVDLVQVVDDVSWRAALINQPDSRTGKSSPAAYPVPRGSLVNIRPGEALLWTHGAVDNINPNRPFLKGGRGTPYPIRLVRHAGHGTWDSSARAILALTKMDWNNDSLYDHLPVTLGYAKVLSRVVKRIGKLGVTPYQFRFFM
jgi:hypothetical protein